jgi:hypothetical protein
MPQIRDLMVQLKYFFYLNKQWIKCRDQIRERINMILWSCTVVPIPT